MKPLHPSQSTFQRLTNMENLLYGGLVLNAATRIPQPFLFEGFKNHREGQHIRGSYNGYFWESCSNESIPEVFMPARDKTAFINYSGVITNSHEEIRHFISELDSTPDSPPFAVNAKDNLLDKLDGSFSLTINNVSTHSTFLLLAKQVELYLFGVTCKEGSFLTWTNDGDFESRMRDRYGNDFWFYRFRPLTNGLIFFPTQRYCARWYQWSSAFNNDKLKTFAALEQAIRRRF